MLCDPPPANAEILPQASQGSYFFNKIGRYQPLNPIVIKALTALAQLRITRPLAQKIVQFDRSISCQRKPLPPNIASLTPAQSDKGHS